MGGFVWSPWNNSRPMSGYGLIDKIEMLPLEERKARKLAGEKAKVEKLLGERRPEQERSGVMPPAPPLQQASLFAARGFRHDAFSPCPLLSIKCMFNGSALYHADHAWFAVNEAGYLILNDQQPYEIQIASPTRVESFIVFFPRGWAEQALDALTLPSEKLLDEPESRREQPVHFFERFTEHDELVSPVLGSLRRAHTKGPLPDIWVE